MFFPTPRFPLLHFPPNSYIPDLEKNMFSTIANQARNYLTVLNIKGAKNI